MNAYKANLLNATALILLSIWAYFGSINPSITAFIPFIFGIILLSLNNGVQYKIISQIRVAAVMTLIVLFALIKPLGGAMDRDDSMAVFRVGLMMATSLLSLVYIIKEHHNTLMSKQN
jgi:hypothetical protein